MVSWRSLRFCLAPQREVPKTLKSESDLTVDLLYFNIHHYIDMNNLVIGENLEIAPHLRAMLQHSFDSLQKLLTPDEMERLSEHVRKVQAINNYNYLLKISSKIQEARLLHFEEKIRQKTTQNLNKMFFSYKKERSNMLLDFVKHLDACRSESDKLKYNPFKKNFEKTLEKTLENFMEYLNTMDKNFEREFSNRIKYINIIKDKL